MDKLILITAIQCLLLVTPGWAQESGSDEKAASAEVAAPVAIPIAEIADRALDTAALLRNAEVQGDVDDELQEIKEGFSAQKKQIDDLQQETLRQLKIAGPVSILEETENDWARIQTRLNRWLRRLASLAEAIGEVREKLREEAAIWKVTQDSDSEDKFPPELRRQIREALSSIDKAERKVRSSRDAILNLQTSIGYAQARADELVANLKEESAKRREQLLDTDSRPLWAASEALESGGSFSDQIRTIWQTTHASIREYVEEQRSHFVPYGLLLVSLIGGLVFLRRKVRVWARQDEGLQQTLKLLDRPVAVTVIITLLHYMQMNPSAPKAWNGLMGIFLLIGVLRVLPQLVPKGNRSWGYLLVLLFFLQQTVELTPDGFLINRLALLLLSLVGIGASWWVARTVNSASWRISETWSRIIKTGAQLSVVLFGIGTLANLIGSVGLAMVTVTATLDSIFSAILFFLAAVLLRAIVSASMILDSVRSLRIVSERGETTRLALFRLIRIFAILGWVVTLLRDFSLIDPILGAVNGMLEASLSLGELSLTLGDILIFALVIGVSFKISQLLRFLLDTEFLPRMELKRGVPEAITRLTHYSVIVMGVILGFTAAGFPLDRITIILGSLGVGIGFGLQNVVNNFVSGLILLFERPIQIGDRILLDSGEAVVQEMGIRASRVRTYAGATIIVPNADLISSQVVNWTLYDDKRRLSIAVGAAYGTEPQTVIDLLLKVATDHPDVLEEPGPTAIFKDFGADALEFQLYAWAWNDSWFRISGELKSRITDVLTGAGIEIPFPQRDLHIRSTDETVSLPTKRRSEEE